MQNVFTSHEIQSQVITNLFSLPALPLHVDQMLEGNYLQWDPDIAKEGVLLNTAVNGG